MGRYIIYNSVLPSKIFQFLNRMDINSIQKVITDIANNTNLIAYLTEDICLRGFCGAINIDIILCPILLTALEVKDKTVYPFFSDKYNCYIKRGCICENTCEQEVEKGDKGCTHSGKLCGGHHIIIISAHPMLIVQANDYVLDFTYKQNLYTRNTYSSEIIKKEIKELPPFLFLPVIDYKKYSEKQIWQTEVASPCYIIRKDACGIQTASGGKQKKSKQSRKYLRKKSKYSKKTRKH